MRLLEISPANVLEKPDLQATYKAAGCRTLGRCLQQQGDSPCWSPLGSALTQLEETQQAASAVLLVKSLLQRAARKGCPGGRAFCIARALFCAPKQPPLTGRLPPAWCRQCRARSRLAAAPGRPRELAMSNSSLTASTRKTRPKSALRQGRAKVAVEGSRKAQELKTAAWRA